MPPRIVAGLSRPQWVAAERALGASAAAAEEKAAILFDSPFEYFLMPFAEMVRIAGANRTIARYVLEANRQVLEDAMLIDPNSPVPRDVSARLAQEAEASLRELERLARPPATFDMDGHDV